MLVSANQWLRGMETYMFLWKLMLVSANQASSKLGQGITLTFMISLCPENLTEIAWVTSDELLCPGMHIHRCILKFDKCHELSCYV